MNTYQMKLAKVPFEKIKNGQKIIESRLYDEKRRQFKVGDYITFVFVDNPNESVSTMITALYLYRSFNDLFSDFPPEYFGCSSKKSLDEEVRTFYTIDEESKYGVVGIKLSLLN